MHPTKALMLTRAIEEERSRALARRQQWQRRQPEEHDGPTRPRLPGTAFLRFLRRAGPTVTTT